MVSKVAEACEPSLVATLGPTAPTVSAALAAAAATTVVAMGINNKQPGTLLATSRFIRISHF
jgi:hypothetical protein